MFVGAAGHFFLTGLPKTTTHTTIMPAVGQWGDDPLSSSYFEGSETLRPYGVHGKGNCFFDSIACALNCKHYRDTTFLPRREQIGKALRASIEKHLEDLEPVGWAGFWNRRKGQFRTTSGDIPSYDNVLKQVRDPIQWAEAPLIVYTMAKLKLNHLFLDQSTQSLYCGVADFSLQNRPLIIILWVDSQHFEPVGFSNTTTFQFPYESSIFKAARKEYINGHCVLRQQAFLGGQHGEQPFYYAFDSSVGVEQRSRIRYILTHYGWPGYTYHELSPDDDDVDAVVYTRSNRAIINKFGTRFDHMNVCVMSTRPRQIYFNQLMWPRNNFHQSVEEYQEYVVLHEFGHAHGLEHVNSVPSGLCHIMTPQSGKQSPTCIPSSRIENKTGIVYSTTSIELAHRAVRPWDAFSHRV